MDDAPALPEGNDGPSASRRTLRRYIRPTDVKPALEWIVQHHVMDRWETLLDVSPGSLRIRRRDNRRPPVPWRRRNLPLRRPHAVAFLPGDTVVIADTENNRLLILDHPCRGRVHPRMTIGGRRLRRPHHVLWNRHDGFLYALDEQCLFRLRTRTSQGESWRIAGRVLGYARALALLDGRVHVIASSHGAVLRIDNFPGRKLTSFRSPQKRRAAPAGSWRETGLVLNDVALLGAWYYGTNYFSPDYAGNGDASEARLIRWRSWKDFEGGRWQDISSCLPQGLVPYFLTVVDGRLHIAAFCHADHRRDGIFRLDPSLLP